jgi:hypothetical protein
VQLKSAVVTLADWLQDTFDGHVEVVCTSDPAQRIKDASVTKEICKRIKACDVVLGAKVIPG